MATAHINIEMLIWARNRCRMSVSELAEKLKITEEKLGQWEIGDREITFKQAQKFANKTYIPFGYLFLLRPPKEELPLPDLRTVDGKHPHEPSVELLDMVKIIMQRQEWYKEYLQEQLIGDNQIVGRFSVQSSVEEIVNDIRQQLNIEAHPSRGSWEDYYRGLVARIEENGIMVMRESFINHHSRPLSVEEFRGFAIADTIAPVIFINHADAPSPRLFTLIHELCHIWIGKTGISDTDPNNHRKEEILCNAVAGELLVPQEEFLVHWDEALDNWKENLPQLKATFHVSTWVLARRALTLNKISQVDYQNYIREQRQAFLQSKESGSGGGPTYYVSKNAQLSSNFSGAVVSEALSGKLLLRDAGRLLNMKPNNIEVFAKELNI